VLYWKLFYLIRWILTVSILIFLRDLPALQVILLQLFSFLTLLIYSKTTIYFDLWTNRMYILNESAVFIYQFFLLSLLDESVSADNRNTLGWGLVLVQLSTVGVNLARLCQKVIGVISLKIKQW
jgi:c-di-AMP phosphodiesterase-like protein